MLHAFSRHEAQAALAAEQRRTGKLADDEIVASLRDRIGLYLRWGLREKALACHHDLSTIPGEFPGPFPEPALRTPGLPFGAGAAVPPMDPEAVREAETRVRTGRARHMYGALHVIAAERSAGVFVATRDDAAPGEAAHPTQSDDPMPPRVAPAGPPERPEPEPGYVPPPDSPFPDGDIPF